MACALHRWRSRAGWADKIPMASAWGSESGRFVPSRRATVGERDREIPRPCGTVDDCRGFGGAALSALLTSSPVSWARTAPSSVGKELAGSCTRTMTTPGNLYLFYFGDNGHHGQGQCFRYLVSQTFSGVPAPARRPRSPCRRQLPTTATARLLPRRRGARLPAGAPVSAYGLNTEPYTTDGFLILPTTVLGNTYIVKGYEGGAGSQIRGGRGPRPQPQSPSRPGGRPVRGEGQSG